LKADEAMVIKVWSIKKHVISLLALSIVSLLLIVFFSGSFDSNHLVLDIVVTVFSVFTTVLVAHKVLENWVYWIFVNSAAVYLFWSNELVLTSALFVIYVAMAVYGYWQWRKQFVQQAHG
jgi:nicotinamide mononucleotide transporter